MKIVIASNNVYKSKELKDILERENIDVVLQSQFNLCEVKEVGLTFVENAILKARNACKHTKMPAIGDDSGLEVDALLGEPGIYSSRYAGGQASDPENIDKLLLKLQDVPEFKRTARFQCVMVFLKTFDDPSPIICQGTWEGRIALVPKGKNGFGYDPIFFLPEMNSTAAELSSAIKNKISHRAKALQKITLLLKKKIVKE